MVPKARFLRAGAWRTGQDLTDAERAQGLADLAVLLICHSAGWPALAEMAAAIGEELAETPVVAHYRLQRGEGRGGPSCGQKRAYKMRPSASSSATPMSCMGRPEIHSCFRAS